MDKKKLKKRLFGDFTLKRLVISIIEIYLCILVYAWFFTDPIIFPAGPSSYKDSPEIIKLDTSDGAQISALYLPNPEADYTVIHSHGNAEDIGDVRPFMEDMLLNGYAVLVYDYRGYGTSDGKPSVRKAYLDADAVYRYATEELSIPPERIIVHGRSLGGALAVYTAEKYDVGALIMESTFVTAFRVKTTIPVAPFDKFNNLKRIKKIDCPVLVIHGTEDRLIPIWHGRKLYKAAPEPKLSLWVEKAGHDNVAWVGWNDYWPAFGELVKLIPSEK